MVQPLTRALLKLHKETGGNIRIWIPRVKGRHLAVIPKMQEGEKKAEIKMNEYGKAVIFSTADCMHAGFMIGKPREDVLNVVVYRVEFV